MTHRGMMTLAFVLLMVLIIAVFLMDGQLHTEI